jgi:hypothetical protein
MVSLLFWQVSSIVSRYFFLHSIFALNTAQLAGVQNHLRVFAIQISGRLRSYCVFW